MPPQRLARCSSALQLGIYAKRQSWMSCGETDRFPHFVSGFIDGVDNSHYRNRKRNKLEYSIGMESELRQG